MDQPLSTEMTMREIVALTEETVRLIAEVVGELGRQIVDWQRLADPAALLVSLATGELRHETKHD